MVLRDERHEAEAAAITGAVASEYTTSRPRSAAHHRTALRRFPSGVTHDSRHAEPFQLCVERAEGAYKWDADGYRYVDYVTGHGALILGHGHPAVSEAVARQLALSTHAGGNHALELSWADSVCALVPGAEQVRFTSSGTEAIMLAVRLARAFTGRTKLVQFAGHFHGWSDTAMGAHGEPGLPVALHAAAEVLPCGDSERLRTALSDEASAAVIIETSHPSFFALPDPAAWLRLLRDETTRTGTLLIVDEVVSGFRWAPGGAQAFYGAHGDLTTLAKILAGGLPGGAVAGRADILASLSFDARERGGRAKLHHPGTYNANPLSSAAGVACLEIVADPAVQERATASARAIRSGMNAIMRREGIPGCVYGESSMFRIVLGGDQLPAEGDMRGPHTGAPIAREGIPGPLSDAFNLSMLLEGVALFGGRGITSIAHGADEIDATLAAFEATIARLRLRETVAAS